LLAVVLQAKLGLKHVEYIVNVYVINLYKCVLNSSRVQLCAPTSA
jgi:hypothetical protein